MFLFGGTSPFPVPNPHEIQDYDVDDNHQGVDAKLMDHSDLHILDFGMFLSFSILNLFILYSCDCSPIAVINFQPVGTFCGSYSAHYAIEVHLTLPCPTLPTYPVISNINMVSGSFKEPITSIFRVEVGGITFH